MEQLAVPPLSLEAPQPEPQPKPVPSPLPPQMASLRSVRRPPSKPWRRPEPPPPRVYHVDPRGFRRLVQRLTGAPRQAKYRAPPPRLELAPRSLPPAPPTIASNQVTPSWPELPAASPKGIANLLSPMDTLGLLPTSLGSLTPSFYSPWCSFPPLSPGSMPALLHSSSSILLSTEVVPPSISSAHSTHI